MNSENPYRSPQTKTESTDTTQSAPENPTLTSILFSFQGRIPRRVHWGVGLPIAFIFIWAESYVDSAIGEDSAVAAIVYLLLCIPFIWISLAVSVKRWHDRDKSGWRIFIGFIPIIGPIWAFIELGCMRGTFGPNIYGPGEMDADTEQTAKPRRRGLRFSLRTLLIVVTVLAIPLGWVGWELKQVRRERATITWVEETGGNVSFHHEVEKSWRVRSVTLNNTQVSDLSPLAELKNLIFLHLRNTQVSNEQVQELRQALPNCRIEHSIRVEK